MSTIFHRQTLKDISMAGTIQRAKHTDRARVYTKPWIIYKSDCPLEF